MIYTRFSLTLKKHITAMENIATLEEMREEAVARMKMIGIGQGYIDAFLNNEITTFWYKWIDGELPDLITEREDCSIVELENRRRSVTWAIIHTVDVQVGDEWDFYCLLFVSEEKDKWEKERKELMDMNPTVFCDAVSVDSIHEFGDFVKIKISVENGILYGMGTSAPWEFASD